MTALCIIIAVILIIAIILLIPIGAEAEYDESGAVVWLRIGAFRRRIYPSERGSTEKKKRKKRKKEASGEQKEKKGGTVQLIMELLPVAIETLGRLRRSLTVKKLHLHFLFAGEDPAMAALSFGGASAGAGMLVPLLQSNFRIKDMDIRNSVDFTGGQDRVYAHADIRLRLAAALAIALRAGVKALKIIIKKSDTEKN